MNGNRVSKLISIAITVYLLIIIGWFFYNSFFEGNLADILGNPQYALLVFIVLFPINYPLYFVVIALAWFIGRPALIWVLNLLSRVLTPIFRGLGKLVMPLINKYISKLKSGQ